MTDGNARMVTSFDKIDREIEFHRTCGRQQQILNEWFTVLLIMFNASAPVAWSLSDVAFIKKVPAVFAAP